MKRRSPAHWTLRRWKVVEEPEDPFPQCYCPCHKRRNEPKSRLVHAS